MGAASLLAASFVTSGISSLGNSYSQSQSIKAQGEFQKKVFEINTKIADYQAEDAVRQGDKTIDLHRQKTKQLIGAQRVALAAQGIDIESGSAIQIQDNTKYVSELDAQTIKNNAYRQAWGYKTQAIDYSARGRFSEISANSAASNSILTGSMQGLSYGLQAGYYYSGAGKGK